MNDAQTVARLLARGYNEHIKAHGPDTDGARPGDAHLTVVHDGREYDVRITPRYMTEGYRFEVQRTCGQLACTDPDHLVVWPAGEPAPSAKEYAAAHPIVCAHADEDGQGSHILAPGEKCDREGQ